MDSAIDVVSGTVSSVVTFSHSVLPRSVYTDYFVILQSDGMIDKFSTENYGYIGEYIFSLYGMEERLVRLFYSL